MDAQIQTKEINFSTPADVLREEEKFSHESPLYLATHAIVDEFISRLSKGDKVLEIGCGSWDLCKTLCERKGVVWEGIDPLKKEKRKDVIATKRGSVHDIPFEENTFDYVIGNQTIEHWHEFGVSFEEALYEIWRVLKPGGEIIMNAPIHLHGHKIFLLDNRVSIRSLFKASMWRNIEIEEWREKEHSEYLGWNICRFSDQVFPVLRSKSSFVINLRARKFVEGEVEKPKFLIFYKIKRRLILSTRITTLTRLAVYHLHYGFRHYIYKIIKSIKQ